MPRCRLLLLLPLVAACDAGGACALDPYALADGHNQAVVDCGTFTFAAATASAMATAQTCVLGAINLGRAFRIVYDAAGTDSHVRVGFTGSVGTSGLRLRSYAYDGDIRGGGGDAHPQLTVTSCGQIQATTACTPDAGKPCLDCQQTGAIVTLCGG
jgi:hypothetical protein